MAKRGKNRRRALRRQSDVELANARDSARGVTSTRQVITHIQGSVFQGPLPPPETLQGYENILPGAADRIIMMAEKNQAHRHSLEARVIPAGIISERIAQASGFVLYLTSLIIGAYLIINDKEVAGLIEMMGTTAAFVGLYFHAQKEKRRELQLKRSGASDQEDQSEQDRNG